jgi:hypothetical protein
LNGIARLNRVPESGDTRSAAQIAVLANAFRLLATCRPLVATSIAKLPSLANRHGRTHTVEGFGLVYGGLRTTGSLRDRQILPAATSKQCGVVP